jgi:hypothetical protein
MGDYTGFSMNRRARAVLKSVVPAACLDHSRIKYVASGGQSDVYRFTDPACGQVLFVKVYRSDFAQVPPHEAQALEILRSAVCNVECEGGWRLDAPRALAASTDPPALVLTAVIGKELDGELDSSDQDCRRAALEALIAGLQAWWRASGTIYGDLNLHNILCDRASRTFHFLDPGSPTPEYECERVSRDWYPYSRDLAYLLFEVTGSNVKLRLTNPGGARRRLQFAEEVLRRFAGSLPDGSIPGFCDEMRACAEVHLARIKRGWGIRGWWRNFVRRSARRAMARVFTELKTACGTARNSAVGG